MNNKYVSLLGAFIAVFFVDRIIDNSVQGSVYDYIGLLIGICLIADAYYVKYKKKH